jgi:excisionase family DNA binding protein
VTRPLAIVPPRPRADIQAAAAAALRALADALEAIPRATPEPRAEELLSYNAVADELGMSPGYVRGLARDGRLAVVRLGSRRRVRRSDLEEFKARRVHRRR